MPNALIVDLEPQPNQQVGKYELSDGNTTFHYSSYGSPLNRVFVSFSSANAQPAFVDIPGSAYENGSGISNYYFLTSLVPANALRLQLQVFNQATLLQYIDFHYSTKACPIYENGQNFFWFCHSELAYSVYYFQDEKYEIQFALRRFRLEKEWMAEVQFSNIFTSQDVKTVDYAGRANLTALKFCEVKALYSSQGVVENFPRFYPDRDILCIVDAEFRTVKLYNLAPLDYGNEESILLNLRVYLNQRNVSHQAQKLCFIKIFAEWEQPGTLIAETQAGIKLKYCP